MRCHFIWVRCTTLFAVGLTVFLLVSGCDAWTKAQGTVRDSVGSAIPDAIVTIKIGNDSRQFRSDENGRYMAQISQPPWKVDCKLTVNKAGFVPYEKRLKGPGVYNELDVVLEPLHVDSSPPNETATPQGIAKAMFPNAPEKAQSVICFRALKPEMSMNTVVEKCGRPDAEQGSGLYIFVWRLADGSTVSIGTATLQRIGDVKYSDPSGKKSSLLHKK
jgi:hypothetical protein